MLLFCKVVAQRTIFPLFDAAFGLPITWVILLVRPIKLIRLGSLNGEKIGPFASQTELYLCEKDHGIQPKDSFDVFVSSIHPFVCNRQLQTMWRRIIRVHDLFRLTYNRMRLNPRYKEHIIVTANDSRDVHGLLERTDVHLDFTDEEVGRAKIELSRMGITGKDTYVLMLNRGQRYLDETFPGIEWSRHEWRNFPISVFMPAAEELTKRNHYVIRVGHLVSDLMNTENPRIIEYDHNGLRTELLDIYLGATCRFLLTCDSGYQAVPGWVFRRPVLNVSYSDFSLDGMLNYLPTWLSIFSRYWLKSEKRFISVPEALTSGVGGISNGTEYAERGIEVVKNTPEEIIEAVVEMEGRLDGTWQTTAEDEELQRRFWDHFDSSPQSSSGGEVPGRIGAKFLRRNRTLFE